MAQKGNLVKLSDIMLDRKNRPNQVVYFIRIHAYSIQVESVVRKCIEKAQHLGMLIDGKLAAPDVRQIAYYQETIGDNFALNTAFINQSLIKWMPRLTPESRNLMVDAIYQMLMELQTAGKNLNIIKNAFIKYMCWLFYRFSQVAGKITSQDAPLIVYCGDISIYELQMLHIMCIAGCDILLILTHGYQDYIKIDSQGHYAQEMSIPGGTSFPDDYSIKYVMGEMRKQAQIAEKNRNNNLSQNVPQNRANSGVSLARPQSAPPTPKNSGVSLARPQSAPPTQKNSGVSLARPDRSNSGVPSARPQSVPPNRPNPSVSLSRPANAPVKPQRPVEDVPRPLDFGPEPRAKIYTNQWQTKGNPLKDILTPFALRTGNPDQICNSFNMISGVENPATYEKELYDFYRQLQDEKRRVVIVENELETPTPEEISRVQRGNYRFPEDMIKALSVNFALGVNLELQKYVVRAFAEVMLQEARQPGMNLNKATNTAVYLICWFRRFQSELFQGWAAPATPCFIHFGAVKRDKEVLFLRMLSCMPVDVLILNPNLNDVVQISDPKLKISISLESRNIEHFPKDNRNIYVSTESYQAERELDGWSDDLGVYRQQQFGKAQAISFHTAYEEISEYWNLETKDRPNFEINRGVVNFPVLFAKVCGVKEEKQEDYWLNVKSFITPETYVIKRLPFMTNSSLSPIALNASDFYRNGKLLRDRIITHRFYNYMLIRQEMQEHMLDKLQEMLDKKVIRGTGQNGTEFMVISAALSLNKDIQRMIQQFDFTRKNPKLLIMNTGETTGTIQDAIVFAFLNMIGFDIAMFIPSGYQCVEQWYQMHLIDEHHVGSYQYQFQVPDFNTLGKNQGWFSRFRRGS